MHKNPSGTRIIAASAQCSTKGLSEIVTIALDKILQIRRKYCQTIYSATGVNTMWIINNNQPLLHELQKINHSKHNQKAEQIHTYDFATLYTNIQHTDLIEKIKLKLRKLLSPHVDVNKMIY